MSHDQYFPNTLLMLFDLCRNDFELSKAASMYILAESQRLKSLFDIMAYPIGS